MANRSDNLEEELKQLKSDHAFLVSEREEFKNTLTSCEERFEELESKSIELMNANIKLQDFVVNLQCENDLLKSELTSRSSGGVLQ
jgi:chromosome segregation ATPase